MTSRTPHGPNWIELEHYAFERISGCARNIHLGPWMSVILTDIARMPSADQAATAFTDLTQCVY